MMYQVFYSVDGNKFASDHMPKDQAEMFVECLENSGIKASLLEREEKRYFCPKVIFDIQLLEKAREACKEGRDMDGLFTFGDPTETSAKDTLGFFQLTDGRKKNGYIVDVWRATRDEVVAFKAKIRYPHLGLYLRKA